MNVVSVMPIGGLDARSANLRTCEEVDDEF